MFIDSHCHLDFSQFEDDFDKILKNAKESNVSTLLSISVNLSDFHKVIKASSHGENIFASVGVHPCNVINQGVFSPDQIMSLCASDKIIGLGETGLDYFHDDSNKKEQKSSFKNHIIASSKTKLPVIVHTRDAENDTLNILKNARKEYDFPFLIHCFSGTYEFAKKCIDLGGYISFSGILTFKNATEIQEVAAKIPLDRILIETDAPYLAPTPYRGKRNEPSYVKYVAESLAKIKNLDIKDIGKATTENFFNLFQKAKI